MAIPKPVSKLGVAWSLYLAIALVIWMDVQVMMIGYRQSIQSVYAFHGVALLVLTL